ncbi:MAG: hypothetical protein LUD29_01045 [Clostridia bacterium]|nr:hypothetical protein [Clostridia bacterium]
MKFQKWLCLCLIVIGALAIVYACVWKTGMLASLATVCDLTNGYANPGLEEAEIFFETDSYNTTLFWLGIATLLAACLLYVFANHKRRNYYVTNYIMSIFVAVVDFVVAIVAIVFDSIYLGDLNAIKANETFMANYAATAEERASVTYSESTGMFVFGYIVCVLLIAGAVFLILNMLWKRKLMRGEKQLLERSFAEEVA